MCEVSTREWLLKKKGSGMGQVTVLVSESSKYIKIQ